MKRFRFLAALFGFGAAAKAQSKPYFVLDPSSVSGIQMPGGALQWFTGKPLNNQCPVCGTTAPVFRPINANLPIYIGGFGMVFPRGTAVAKNLTQCVRCNNAFWQLAQ